MTVVGHATVSTGSVGKVHTVLAIDATSNAHMPEMPLHLCELEYPRKSGGLPERNFFDLGLRKRRPAASACKAQNAICLVHSAALQALHLYLQCWHIFPGVCGLDLCDSRRPALHSSYMG